MAGAVFVVCGAAVGAAATSGASGVVQVASLRPMAVTTVPDASTTLPGPTTTAASPTTETTTTTTEPSTTTSSSTTASTIPPASVPSSGSSSPPWGLIIAILAVVAVALIVVLVLLRRSSNRAKHEWNDAAASALRDAELTRDMLAGEAQPGDPENSARLTAVRSSVERVATTFEQLATTAPDDAARRNSIGLASSLRGYLFVLEAEQLLRRAPTPPTAEQLANADAAKRARAAELDAAIGEMRARVGTEGGGR